MSNSAATDPSSSDRAARWALAEADQKLAALAVDDPDRIGQPGRSGATRLKWSSAGTGLGRLVSLSHSYTRSRPAA